MQPNRRSRKRARQAEEADEARSRFRWALLASDALRKISLSELGLSVVDVEILPDLSGDPNGMCGYIIFASRAEVKRAHRPGAASSIESKVRSGLADAGFPSSAIESFEVRTTSLPDIEAGGGRFHFFR
jgi:hypothetical protein